MGAWSTRIFDDDGAEDIISEYRILLGYGVSPEKTYHLIKEHFYQDYAGGDEEDVYWLSIALYQWQNGILMEEIPPEGEIKKIPFKKIVTIRHCGVCRVCNGVSLNCERREKKFAEITCL